MKYEKPFLEITELETSDIMLTSGANGGSITANGVTITGKEDEFSVDFSDLVGNF